MWKRLQEMIKPMRLVMDKVMPKRRNFLGWEFEMSRVIVGAGTTVAVASQTDGS